MATSTQTILTTVTTLLQDPTFVRWPLLELFNYVSDGQREICLYKPNAYVVLETCRLDGGTKQRLPDGTAPNAAKPVGLTLLDVVRNRGIDGNGEGNAIRVVSREILDAQVASWHSTAADGVVKHYIYNPLDPLHFYVYPPQPSGASTQHYVEILYGAVPAALTAPGTTTSLSNFSAVNIVLPDIWANALANYTMFRAYSKDAEYAQNGALAQKYYELFMSAVTGKTAVEQAVSPNQNIGGFNPNLSGRAVK